ncbi:MAG TPA: hypothetical protein VGN07_09375 [Steroidobacteraceae bacterium]|jgi:hypothetical protein
MDKTSQLAQLTLQLARLAADPDWRALAGIDRDIALVLQRLSQQEQWTPTELVALRKLRTAHEAARERCVQESTRVEAKLTQMRTHKDGWMAYAMNNEFEGRA